MCAVRRSYREACSQQEQQTMMSGGHRQNNVNFSQVYHAVQSIPRGYCPCPSHFSIRRLPSVPNQKDKIRVCFCSMAKCEDFRPTSIYYVDVEYEGKTGEQDLPWKPLLDNLDTTRMPNSLADELLKERMRAYTEGISDYSLSTPEAGLTSSNAQLLYTFGGTFLATVSDIVSSQSPPYHSEVHSLTMGCLMPEMCPLRSNLVAFTDGVNLYAMNLHTSPSSSPLKLSGCSGPGLSAGFPTYIMQEEFDRYKGFWWRPVVTQESEAIQEGQTEEFCILYEENDESAVPILRLPDFSGDQQHQTEAASTTGDGVFRFPRPGQNNSISNLKLARFHVVKSTGALVTDTVVVEELSLPLMQLLPGYEYLVRCGWTACGKFVWCHLLNRTQTKATLFAIPVESFTARHEGSQSGDATSRVIHLLTRECDDSTWITVDDYFHIFSSEVTDGMCSVEFLITSEHEDNRHIYYFKRQWPQNALQVNNLSRVGNAIMIESTAVASKAVTCGKLEVTSDTPMVDEARSLVYFTARQTHPLMDHVYVQHFRNPSDHPTLLTPDVHFTYSPHLDVATNMIVLTSANLECSGSVNLMHIRGLDTGSVSNISLEHSGQLHPAMSHWQHFKQFPLPTLQEFRLTAEEDGLDTTLYGLLFLPQGPPPTDKGHPCLHYIYGGPGVQMVNCDYPKHIYLFAYQCTSQGYAVFVCDGPGSNNRGNHFASPIKYRMGRMELQFQLKFLQDVARRHPIDLSRVAIHGWSYGGYMTLMAMAHFKEHYRVGLAGGSVTQWELYDTGYTERFMGLPSEHQDAYDLGNVLASAHLLPDERHRLLLIHGGKDENVHIFHVTSLIERMDELNKPYDFLLYPKGRHRIRMREHLVASMIAYLKENL